MNKTIDRYMNKLDELDATSNRAKRISVALDSDIKKQNNMLVDILQTLSKIFKGK